MQLIAMPELCETIMLALVLFLYKYGSLIIHARRGSPAPTHNVESNVDSTFVHQPILHSLSLHAHEEDQGQLL